MKQCGDEEKVIESAEGLPISFTISKPTVISELDKERLLQGSNFSNPASAQAEAHTMSFRYEVHETDFVQNASPLAQGRSNQARRLRPKG